MKEPKGLKTFAVAASAYVCLSLPEEEYDPAGALRVLYLWWNAKSLDNCRQGFSRLYGGRLYKVIDDLERVSAEVSLEDLSLSERVRKAEAESSDDESGLPYFLEACKALAFVVGPKRHELVGSITGRCGAKSE